MPDYVNDLDYNRHHIPLLPSENERGASHKRMQSIAWYAYLSSVGGINAAQATTHAWKLAREHTADQDGEWSWRAYVYDQIVTVIVRKQSADDMDIVVYTDDPKHMAIRSLDPEPAEIECTAWDCCGTYAELVDTTHVIVVKGGTAEYEHAAPAKQDQRVRLARLEADRAGIHQINRYVDAERPVILKPIKRKV